VVAYSFQRRFVDPIVSGTKKQTIRADRRRHARYGEEIQLYTGMRTKGCRLVGLATCGVVSPITLDFIANEIDLNPVSFDDGVSLDRFARSDGFHSWEDLCTFWRVEHEGISRWSGVLIRWHGFRVLQAVA
jgi:hypothetical protein